MPVTPSTEPHLQCTRTQYAHVSLSVTVSLRASRYYTRCFHTNRRSLSLSAPVLRLTGTSLCLDRLLAAASNIPLGCQIKTRSLSHTGTSCACNVRRLEDARYTHTHTHTHTHSFRLVNRRPRLHSGDTGACVIACLTLWV